MVHENNQTSGRHRRLSDSDDSDREEKQERVLTVAKAADKCPKEFRLIAKGGGFTSVDDLSALKQIDYVDLSHNLLTSVAGLSGNRRLKTVNLLSNRLTDVQPLLRCEAIRVLNVSENSLPTLEWLRYGSFSAKLLTLVSTGNRIVTLDGIRALKEVRTLILSHNELEDLKPLAGLPCLEKLSASHNKLRAIPPEFGELHQLRELRVSHNRIAELPPSESLGRMTSLCIFDFGHNNIRKFDTLSACLNVININLRGNPGCEALDDVNASVRRLCESIQIIDGVRVAGGRRKVRINRLRVATGMQIETDRKFVRPPPTAAVKRLLERKGATNKLDDATRAEGVRILEQTVATEALNPLSIAESDDTDVETHKETKKKRLDTIKTDHVHLVGIEKSSTQQGQSEKDSSRGSLLSKPIAGFDNAAKPDIDVATAKVEIDESAAKPGIEGSDGNRTYTTQHSDSDKDREIQPEDFIRQARANTVVKPMGEARVKYIGNSKRNRSHKKKKRVLYKPQFGDGGESKW